MPLQLLLVLVPAFQLYGDWRSNNADDFHKRNAVHTSSMIDEANELMENGDDERTPVHPIKAG
jgi:hypothetical protein